MQNQPLLENEWGQKLKPEWDKPYYRELSTFLELENSLDKDVYPEKIDILNAFKLTDFSKIKVVIIGQDPYHGPGQAMGLSFSVPTEVKMPPSLKNIVKEIERDLVGSYQGDGDLTYWAQQGVFLLNTVLTVEAHKPASHQKRGWEVFTDKVITLLNERSKPLVFMLWGKHAQSKSNLLNNKKHLILETSHPSPFSVRRGFGGCGHFSASNKFLEQNGFSKIDWLQENK